MNHKGRHPKKPKTALGKLIYQRWVKDYELTYRDLADFLKLKDGTINHWCMGRHQPRAYMVRALAEAIRADIDDVLEAIEKDAKA